MVDVVRLPHSNPEEPLREAVAYLHGELNAEERTAFEAHLPSCERCREAVAVGRELFPAVDRLLAESMPVRKPADYLALFAAAEAKVAAEARAEAPAPRERPAPRRRAMAWAWGALGAAAAAGAAAFLVLRPPPPHAEVALVEPARIRTVELAPAPPGTSPPPLPVPLPVDARVTGTTLSIGAPRLPADRYTTVILVDAKGATWLVQDAEKPDPTCAPRCGPLHLRVDLAPLPPGPIRVRVALGDAPKNAGPPLVEVRAMGEARITP